MAGLLSALGPRTEWRDVTLERFRRAAVRALSLSNNGRSLTQEAREWGTYWASIPPLQRPLSTGEPK